MDKAKKVLGIVDENGFDWWDHDRSDVHFNGERIFTVSWSGTITVFEDWFTLADLPTNKSFLEAMAIAYCKKNFSYKIWAGELWQYAEELQIKLIKDLTYNNSNKFWDICLEFIRDK